MSLRNAYRGMLSIFERPEIIFVYVFLGLGFVYLILMPPFEIPDEPQHFFRAYQVSQGKIVSDRVGSETGGELPASLALLLKDTLHNIPFHSENKYDLEFTRQSLRRPLDADEVRFIPFSNTALYSPVGYLPQATGILIGRLLNLAPILLMYLGRLTNLLATATLCAIAMRTTPVFKNVFFLIALSPVFLCESASLSPDGLTNGLSLLLTAVMFRCAFESTVPLTVNQILLMAGLSVSLTLCKNVYFILSFLYFLIPKEKAGSRWKYYGAGAAIFLIAVLAFYTWNRIAISVYSPIPGFVNLVQAEHDLLSHPFQVAGLVLKNQATYWQFYISSAFGYLGWLDAYMPVVQIYLFVFLLLAAGLFSAVDGVNIRLKDKALIFLIAVAGTTLILVSMYLVRVEGANEIRLAQGRYFLPFIPLFISVLHSEKSSRWVSRQAFARIVTASGILFSLLGIWLVIHRYYVL